jgi:hypothetical protein
MTTRLSQRKIKGGDPAYQTLKQEMDARAIGGGTGGYTVPAGGIPRADMTQDVRDALAAGESAYLLPGAGVPLSDLEQGIQETLTKADTSYQKPVAGIPLSDLEDTIQDRLTDFSNFYIYPTNGIPYVDLDPNLQTMIQKGESAYQKPVDGIGEQELTQALRSKIAKGTTAYQKPVDGIPLTELKEAVTVPEDLLPMEAHMRDTGIHITNHDDLIGIGSYSHDTIDVKLDENQSFISELRREITNARDSFATLGGRIDAMLGRNSYYTIDSMQEWKMGTFTDLIVNEEGNVSFDFDKEQVSMALYNISEHDSFIESERIGTLMFGSETLVNLQNNDWVEGINKRNDVGVSLQAYVYAPKTGIYNFAVQFSGRLRLKVGGQLLFDRTGSYTNVSSLTTEDSIELEGGRLYPITIEGWYRTNGDRVVGLYWKPPGQSYKSTIPFENLNMSGYTVTDGVYETPVIDLVDDSISLWYLEADLSEYRSDDDLTVEVSTSIDGVTFSDWTPFVLNEEIPVTPRRFSKFRVTLHKEYAQYTPLIQSLKVRYISSAVNEMREELMAARSTYLTLDDRLGKLDTQIGDLSKLYEISNLSGIHPEQFASVRLLQMDLNMLHSYLREAEARSEVIRLEDGVADTFVDASMIDDTLSTAYEVKDGALIQKQSLFRMEKDQEWSAWILDRLDYYGDSLQLGYSNDPNDIINMVQFSNWYLWSTRNTARISGDYQDVIAQPFYTGDDISVLTRLQVQTYDYYNQPYMEIMICPTVNGHADIKNPIFQNYIGRGGGSYNLSNIRVPVSPLTKYWIVVRMTQDYNSNGYARWYQSYNNSSTNIRLRGSNPENGYLYMEYSSNDGQNWSTDGGYFLSFVVDESTSFEENGSGYRILDYGSPQRFVSTDINLDNDGDGLFTVNYQSSMDQNIWSAPEQNVIDLPVGRFLKINITMSKASTGYGSPRLLRFDVYHYKNEIEVITKPLVTKYVPTHFIVTTQESDPDAVEYYVSRDDGHTWLEIATDHYNPLDSIRPGTNVRFKVAFNGLKPLTKVFGWAFIALRYRDVSGQNITALYEEYDAGDEQTDFVLDHPYPMGNHALQVYVNGIRQSIFKDYLEIDQHTIQFTEPLIGGVDGDRVTFAVATGAYDVHDASITDRIDSIERLFEEELYSQRKVHEYDENGRLSKTTFIGAPKFYEISYTYLPDGKRETETVIRGEHKKHVEYKYDDQNRISEEIITISEVTS